MHISYKAIDKYVKAVQCELSYTSVGYYEISATSV
jgi:hypothetical protein